jgi:hypothetical protein
MDPLRRRLQAAKGAGARGAALVQPFKAPSPMKASACPGDFVGTLGGKVEFIPVRRVAHATRPQRGHSGAGG